MDLNELEEAFPGSRSLALSEQRANKATGENKRKKYYDASQINSNSTSDCLFSGLRPWRRRLSRRRLAATRASTQLRDRTPSLPPHPGSGTRPSAVLRLLTTTPGGNGNTAVGLNAAPQ